MNLNKPFLFICILFISIIRPANRSAPRETEVCGAVHFHIANGAHVRFVILDVRRDETRAFSKELDQSITFRPETQETGWDFTALDCAGRRRHAAVLETHLEELTLVHFGPFRDASTLGFRVCELPDLALSSVQLDFPSTAAFLEEEREFGGDAIGRCSPGRWAACACGRCSPGRWAAWRWARACGRCFALDT
jgi:hypothetical protein